MHLSHNVHDCMAALSGAATLRGGGSQKDEEHMMKHLKMMKKQENQLKASVKHVG